MTASRGLVLVVDDEPQIHRVLTPALVAAGYDTLRAERGDQGLQLAAFRAPDLILLDLALPDMDGHEVLAKLRKFCDAPVIVLSARDSEIEKITSLDAGADDYVEKPFRLGELLARMRTALRHRSRQENTDAPISLGGVIIDTTTRQITLSGTALSLTNHELALLLLLARNRGRLLTHNQILTAVWGHVHADDVTYLRVYIGRLRRKLGADFAESIITEPGVGYRLQDDVGTNPL
jgi:two-component system, OmpR family, KDP operon response regulator KdpE